MPETPGLSFSIVVNTCDRRDALRTLLYSLNRQTYRNFEVVVVLGPTHDDSAEMLAEEFGDQVVLARCEEFNLSTSRNLGIAQAAGDIVAFIDDDAVPCSTWLSQLEQAYLDPEVAGVGGRTYNIWPQAGELQFFRGVVSVVAEQEDVRRRDLPTANSAVSTAFWYPRFHGTNMTYRRQMLLDTQGFDERLEYLFDDADIAIRWGRAGLRLLQLDEATVYHIPASGRNRGKNTYDLNWYCWLRSTIYFALKNGVLAVGWVKSLKSARTTTSMFFSQIADLERRELIPSQLAQSARRMLRRGSFEGYLQGILASRKMPAGLRSSSRDFAPFPREDSHRYPAISPIQGPSNPKVEAMTSEPLRVCLLSVGYPPGNTHGVARSTHTLAQGLAELGHEVHVITAGERHTVTHRDGAFIHQVSGARNPRYDLYRTHDMSHLANWLNHSHAVLDHLRSLCVDHDIQVVDSPLWNLDGLVTAMAGDLPVCVRVVTSMKQIATIHGRGSEENRILGELETELLEKAAVIVSNSQATVRTLQEVYGLDLEEHGHRLARYGMVPAADEEVPDPDSDEMEEVRVLFVGRLEKRKGILDLFEAIPKVMEHCPGARFQIVGGDNSGEDGFRSSQGMDYKTYFEKKYSRWSHAVEFSGFVDERELQEQYRSCSVFVAPSLYESFGLIFLEAMNYARPVVGCRAGGPEEIIVHGETGLLVPPEDPEALADSIARLVESPQQRRQLGSAGRRRLLERYSHTAMASEFVDVYRLALSRAADGGEHEE